MMCGAEVWSWWKHVSELGGAKDHQESGNVGGIQVFVLS